MPNRLADETSPYLRQHADNPVDWYPWGDEAFSRARDEDKPVLLSVGYSSCHWCHVMAHESFEDPATAGVMNDLFVNIKVDREERPDVDAIYMEAVQTTTGHGGWPMTVFLTPDGKPFFAGTYFPKTERHGLPSFVQLCRAVDDAWRTRREELVGDAERITGSIGQTALLEPSGQLPDMGTVDGAVAALVEQGDREWGGFGRAPKFPMTDAIELLLRAHRRTGDGDALALVTTTLDAMASGGIYDHLGGGFSRYSVDAFWMVPHFEKMLYDQAQLLRSYLHGWQVTGNAAWRQVIDEIVTYVLRDLRHEDGGLYSAEDADSEGEEGRFYVWRGEEVDAVCGDLADAAIAWYGVTKAGNFEGSNILHRPVRGDLLRPPEIERARAALFEARTHRVRPGLDDKVLTEWNAMFVSALAEAGAATDTRAWIDAAARTGAFLLAQLRRPDGRWLRSWQAEGGARHLGYAVDYAALVDAFVRLAEATGEAGWIEEAATTADAMVDLFWDDERGGLFTTGRDAERLVTRAKDVLDHAVPSANATAAVALLRLAALSGETRYEDRALDIMRLLAEPVRRHPSAFNHLLQAVELHAGPAMEVVITGDRADLLRAVHDRWLPNAVVAWGEQRDSPLWEGREPGLAYVCEHFACRRPVSSVDELVAQLEAR